MEQERNARIQCDSDVEEVAAFMQRTLPAGRLLPVAEAIAGIAPMLWGHFTRDLKPALAVREPAISGHGPHTQSASSE